jgi:hypothetical protein
MYKIFTLRFLINQESFSEESSSASGSSEDITGRGWFDSVTSVAKDLGKKAYQGAKDTDWENVASKAKDAGESGYETAKKYSRKKRSYESFPSPLEQLLSGTDDTADPSQPKSLYVKRSIGNGKFRNSQWNRNQI